MQPWMVHETADNKSPCRHMICLQLTSFVAGGQRVECNYTQVQTTTQEVQYICIVDRDMLWPSDTDLEAGPTR